MDSGVFNLDGRCHAKEVTNHNFKLLIGEKTVIDKQQLIHELDFIRKKNCQCSDYFTICLYRATLLINFIKYVDTKSNTQILMKGLMALHSGMDTDITRRQWFKLRGDSMVLLNKIPVGLRWLIIHIFVYYCSYAKLLKRSKSSLLRNFQICMTQMAVFGFAARDVLSVTINFNITVLKEIRNRSKKNKSLHSNTLELDDVSESETWSTNSVASSRSPPRSKSNILIEGTQPDNPPVGGSSRVTFNEEQRSYPVPEMCWTSGLGEERVFSVSEVHFITNMKIHSRYNGQKLMSTLRPNRCIAKATRDVLAEIISYANETPEMTLKFDEIIKSFIKRVTISVVGKVTFELSDMIKILSLSNDVKITDAIKMCIHLYPYIHSEEPIVGISWNSVGKWVKDISKMLNDEIVRITLKRTLNDQTEDLKFEYSEFRRRMEDKIREKHSVLLPLFKRLSRANDMCLYMLFGLNIIEMENHIVYTDLIVRSILLAWKTLGRFPGERAYGLKNIFWSLPIAYITNLRGFGAVDAMENRTDTLPSIDDFMQMGLGIAVSNDLRN